MSLPLPIAAPPYPLQPLPRGGQKIDSDDTDRESFHIAAVQRAFINIYYFNVSYMAGSLPDTWYTNRGQTC